MSLPLSCVRPMYRLSDANNNSPVRHGHALQGTPLQHTGRSRYACQMGAMLLILSAALGNEGASKHDRLLIDSLLSLSVSDNPRSFVYPIVAVPLKGPPSIFDKDG